MDTELFELCKSVYEKLGWETSSLAGWIEAHQEYEADNGDYTNENHPPSALYTSDYILEKLPARIWNKEESQWDGLWLRKWDRGNELVYFAEYWTRFSFPKQVESDTPLKALLKLTLKLADEGIITKGDK